MNVIEFSNIDKSEYKDYGFSGAHIGDKKIDDSFHIDICKGSTNWGGAPRIKINKVGIYFNFERIIEAEFWNVVNNNDGFRFIEDNTILWKEDTTNKRAELVFNMVLNKLTEKLLMKNFITNIIKNTYQQGLHDGERKVQDGFKKLIGVY